MNQIVYTTKKNSYHDSRINMCIQHPYCTSIHTVCIHHPNHTNLSKFAPP